MDVDQLAADERLSPELVLVLPPALRAQALASLGPPVFWTAPRLRRAVPAPLVRETRAPSLGTLLMARAVQLGLIFALVTIATLAMSLAAHAFR